LKEAKVSLSLVRELRGFMELYSTTKPDYDYFDWKHGTTFSVFAENFEEKAQAIEAKVARALNGFDEEEAKTHGKPPVIEVALGLQSSSPGSISHP
jgi:hypothetical protein